MARGGLKELRSGRAGRPYAGQARPQGVLLAIRARKRALSARLGDSFYFAKCEIVESLLRRGARVPLGTRKLELARQQEGTGLKPAGPPTKVEKTPTKAPTGPRGELAMLRIAGA